MASNSQLKDGYKRAAENFKDSIPADLTKRFAKQTNNLASLRDEIKAIQDDHGKKGSLRNLPRLQKFVEAMNQLGQVIEVFVNANDLVCFIWIAKAHLDNFDKLLDVYSQIGDVIPGLLFYKDMFTQHEPLRDVLQDYYSDILKFHEAAIKVFAQWKDIFHATWKTFNTQFDPIMKSLVKRGELLESVKLSASLDQIHIIRRQISDMYQDQIRTADEKTREKHFSRMALIKEKLRAPEYFLDQEIATQRREGDRSGQWIFGEPEYLAWSDTNALKHSVLYINGIPGAGKTTLVSLIISRLLEVHTPNQSPPVSVSYFYFKHGDDERNSHESFLRAILTQLISQNMMSSQEFFEDFAKQNEVSIRSRESLETLTQRALEEYRVSFLILDGLDECEREQARRTVEWLLALRRLDKYVGKTSLRIIFSGQRDGLLDDVLSEFPNIRLESTKHNADIERYSLQYASKRQKRFRLNKDLETHIASLVTKGAQGMFLYARVVLDYLFRQVSLKELKNALGPDVFPSKLETAIATSVLEEGYESETVAARKVLSLVVAAKRDLRWREIQAFFCIDSKEGTIDLDNRLQTGAKELCGSLVDLHQVNERMSEPESVVRIVHYTAKRYLIERKIIDDCLENARILSFCTEYLISPPFARSNRSDVISSHARQAHYSLQDYAAAHCHETLETPRHRPELERKVQQTIHSTKLFLQDYATSFDMKEDDDSLLTPQSILSKFPHDKADRSENLDIEQRTSRIRREIEDLKNLEVKERTALENLHGPTSCYKCPKPGYVRFSEGFATKKERAEHINHHTRPFVCTFEDCFANVIGFETEVAKDGHDKTHHSQVSPLPHFPELGSQRHDNDGPIWKAAAAGNIGRVKEHLDRGADVNLSGHQKWETALYFAAKRNDYAMCNLLIDRGAVLETPNTVPEDKFADTMSATTPLAIACAKGHTKVADLIFKAAIKAGAVINTEIGFIKAIARNDIETVKVFLSSRHFDHSGFRAKPLEEACYRHHISMLDLLLQHGFESQASSECIDRLRKHAHRWAEYRTGNGPQGYQSSTCYS
ncbi:Zinc finger protein [Colletotrichum asianum]